MVSVAKSVRRSLLRLMNHRRLDSAVSRIHAEGRLPTFVIASPPDMHLAPLAVSHGHPRIGHVIVGNGIVSRDVEWLQAQSRGVPVVQLTASLNGNIKTYLSHAEVIRLCQRASHGDFAIQDADCFVTNPAWWNDFQIHSNSNYAAGPFYKPIQRLKALMPDTFLVVINGTGYRRREAQGIRPDIYTDPKPIIDLLRSHGVKDEYFPEEGKRYADTMQVHWLAATLNGEEFRTIPGEDHTVFHVGGSSYLTTHDNSDVTQWDYWPLNTCYFHMRILEFRRFAAIKPRHARLFQTYGSPEAVIKKYPEFQNSRRYAASQKILDCFSEYLQATAS